MNRASSFLLRLEILAFPAWLRENEPLIDPKEQDEIVRAYFRAVEPDEQPACPNCGETLEIRLRYGSGAGPLLEVECLKCKEAFGWEQTRSEQLFKPLHLAYFMECHRRGKPLRCPVDDSSVAYFVHSDGILDFRCPYCNRRGQSSITRKGNQSEASS